MAKGFSKKFYNSKEWKQCRASYISSVNHMCERCIKKDIYRVGYIVHHIKHLTPLNIDNPDITLNFDNLEYVCLECHNDEHGVARVGDVTRAGTMFNEHGELVCDNLE